MQTIVATNCRLESQLTHYILTEHSKLYEKNTGIEHCGTYFSRGHFTADSCRATEHVPKKPAGCSNSFSWRIKARRLSCFETLESVFVPSRCLLNAWLRTHISSTKSSLTLRLVFCKGISFARDFI